MELKPTGSREPARRTTAPIPCVTAVLLLALIAGSPTATAQEDEGLENAVKAPLAPRSMALDAVAVDGTLIAVGHRGHILISNDGGATWQQADVPSRAGLTGVTFLDRDHGWAVGHDAVILRTLDGGTTWERVHWAPDEEAPLFDVFFSDLDHGVAIGAYGSYYVSDDGGASWTFEPLGDADWHLHEIALADDGTLYLAAEAGMAYRSDDGGTTWEELPSPYEGSFFGVLPLADDVVLIFGLRGHLFRSEDRGETWAAVETGTVAMLTDGLQLADGRVVVTGLGGVVLVSDDGGRTFTLHQRPGRRGIQAAVAISDDTLLLAGEFGLEVQPLAGLEPQGGDGP